jgi:hypothetical protein
MKAIRQSLPSSHGHWSKSQPLFLGLILLAVTCTAAFVAPSKGSAQPPLTAGATLSSADTLVLEAAATVEALFHSIGDRVWPGYDLARRPVFVYLPDRWAVLLNAPRPAAGFEAYPQDWPPVGAPAQLHRGSFPGLAGQLDFDLEVDGIKTVALAPTMGLASGRRAAIGLGVPFIVHEAFHQFQHDAFTSIANDEPEENYPILDGENTALASLEMQILIDAVKAVARGDTAQVREQVVTFLAVRSARWARRPDDIPFFERPQELMEGSAQYVQVRSVGLLAGLCAKEPTTVTPSGKSAFSCDVFKGADTEHYLISDFEDRLSDGVINTQDMARNRVYPAGAALGLLLDFFEVEWKTRVSDAAQSPGLAEQLGERFPLEPSRSESLLVRAKERYGYVRLRATAEERLRIWPIRYQTSVDSLKAVPGYHLSVQVPIQGLSRSRTCAGRRLVLENPTRSFSEICRTYTLKHRGSDDLFLEVHDSAMAEETSADGKARTVTFVGPDLRSVELDGQPAQVAEGGTREFQRLRLIGSTFQIRYDGQGTISRKGPADLLVVLGASSGPAPK